MFCVKCNNQTTQVINSRHSSKTGRVWRRRQCKNCSFIFTTYEELSLEQVKVVISASKRAPFNATKLLLSIASCFEHNSKDRIKNTKWLTDTVIDKLLKQHNEALTIQQIGETTYETLARFDRLASVQYAAKHSDILKRYLRA